MKTPILKQTKEYRLFKFDSTNRTVRRQVKKIIVSMKQYGFLPAHPLAVVSNGAHMVIKDGQHRFEAAKELGLPVWYVCHSDYANVSIPEINGAVAGAWNPTDYMESYHNQGKAEYGKLRAFVHEFKIPPGTAASLLSGNQPRNGSSGDLLRSGKFVVRDVSFAIDVAKVIVAARKAVNWASTKPFVDAVSKAVRVIGSTVIVERIQKNPELLRHSGSTDGFLDMLEVLVNYRNRHPIPLKFQANEAARKRNPVTTRAEREQLKAA